jgi:hypothetical protein
MIAVLFDKITRLSIRFRWLVIILALLTLAAGVLAMSQLNLALLPSIEFPQTVIVVQWSEAESVNQFLEEVTIPLEESLQTVDGVVNIESTTSSGLAFIITRNEFGRNPETVLKDIEAAIVAINLPEGAEPNILNFSLDDLPVVTASASSGSLSLPELKALVSSDLIPVLEGLEQVSEATVSGGQELPPEPAEGVAEVRRLHRDQPDGSFGCYRREYWQVCRQVQSTRIHHRQDKHGSREGDCPPDPAARPRRHHRRRLHRYG